jgi:hypothetical protein
MGKQKTWTVNAAAGNEPLPNIPHKVFARFVRFVNGVYSHGFVSLLSFDTGQ